MSAEQIVPATELAVGDVIFTPTTDGTGLRSTVRYVTQHGGFVIADTDTGVKRYNAKRARVRIEQRVEPAAFAVGDAIALRRQPTVRGTVLAAELVAPTPARPLSTWFFTSSWGSTYPAHELIAVESYDDGEPA